jgi:N utilization substance protein B
MMGSRRRSRELAMQALFYVDMGRGEAAERLALFCGNRVIPAAARPFFDALVQGVLASREQLDRLIEHHSRHWKVARMSGVDRNAMRIALYEMLRCAEIPPKVSINEAIEMGKKYGSEESGAFINGILDSLHLALLAGEIALEAEAEAPLPPAAPPDPTPPARPRPRALPAMARVRGKPGVVKKARRGPPPQA